MFLSVCSKTSLIQDTWPWLTIDIHVCSVFRRLHRTLLEDLGSGEIRVIEIPKYCVGDIDG